MYYGKNKFLDRKMIKARKKCSICNKRFKPYEFKESINKYEFICFECSKARSI